MQQDQVVVIGAGMAGLAAAIDCAAAGFAVHVVERMETPGGKMRRVAAGACLLDAGPTVMTMRWVFEGLLAAAGTDLAREVRLTKADILARHAWPDGGQLDLHADVDRSAEAIAVFAGGREAEGYRRFTADSAAIFAMLRDSYIDAPRPDPFSLMSRIGFSHVGAMFRMKPFDTLWQALGGYFRDERLRQLFGRYATYCGSSPFKAPATLMLVAHVEQDGVWLVEGGMHRLAEALRAVAERLGVKFRFGADVEEITVTHGAVTGLRLAGGETIAASAVISNADISALGTGRLGAAPSRAVTPTPERDRSLSALTFAILATTSGFPLVRHNVFFSRDYRAEFEALFGRQAMPAEPTIYVCAQDRDDRGARLDGGADGAAPERLFIILNAPAIGDRHAFSQQEVASWQDQTITTLARMGLTIAPEAITPTTPTDFERLFPATGGALYGRASHGWNASFQRPGSRTKITGLYLASGSAHPGPGIPMATLSGRLAAASLVEDRASTPRFRPAAISGGTSTG